MINFITFLLLALLLIPVFSIINKRSKKIDDKWNKHLSKLSDDEKNELKEKEKGILQYKKYAVMVPIFTFLILNEYGIDPIVAVIISLSLYALISYILKNKKFNNINKNNQIN